MWRWQGAGRRMGWGKGLVGGSRQQGETRQQAPCHPHSSPSGGQCCRAQTQAARRVPDGKCQRPNCWYKPDQGDLAQVVQRPLSMREVGGSMPSISRAHLKRDDAPWFSSACGVGDAAKQLLQAGICTAFLLPPRVPQLCAGCQQPVRASGMSPSTHTLADAAGRQEHAATPLCSAPSSCVCWC